MSTKSGRIAGVKLGATAIAGQGTWSFGGFTREIIEEDSWDIDIKKKYFGVGDAGTLSFSGLYDAQATTFTTGQNAINSACINSSAFEGGNVSTATLNFFIDNTSYWTATTGGEILITKCQAITMDKSGMGTIDFEAVISGGVMILI